MGFPDSAISTGHLRRAALPNALREMARGLNALRARYFLFLVRALTQRSPPASHSLPSSDALPNMNALRLIVHMTHRTPTLGTRSKISPTGVRGGALRPRTFAYRVHVNRQCISSCQAYGLLFLQSLTPTFLCTVSGAGLRRGLVMAHVLV